jgi:hypothetical protein
VNATPAFEPATLTRSCAPLSLATCWLGFRDEGKIHLEILSIRRARIARLSLVRSSVRRAADDFPLVIRNCPRSRFDIRQRLTHLRHASSEAGGPPDERLNGLGFDAPILEPTTSNIDSDLRSINIHAEPLKSTDVQTTTEALAANPPMKFDLAGKFRVFNAFKLVELKLHALSLARKRVPIPSDLMGLAKDPQSSETVAQCVSVDRRKQRSFPDRVTRLKQFIVKEQRLFCTTQSTVI